MTGATDVLAAGVLVVAGETAVAPGLAEGKKVALLPLCNCH